MRIKQKQTGTKKPLLKPKREISAGGLVVDEQKILLIEVKNLSGKIVWSFPKGKLEPKETNRQAALREVREETGFECLIIKSLGNTKYRYVRANQLLHKTVSWFLMQPLKKVGTFDPQEIRKSRWFSFKDAKKKLIYPLDKKLFKNVIGTK